MHTPGSYLPAMGCVIKVFLGVWVWHPGWVTPHNVEVGPGSHSGLGMPLDFGRAWGMRGVGGEEENGVIDAWGTKSHEKKASKGKLSQVRMHTVHLTGIHHG